MIQRKKFISAVFMVEEEEGSMTDPVSDGAMVLTWTLHNF